MDGFQAVHQTLKDNGVVVGEHVPAIITFKVDYVKFIVLFGLIQAYIAMTSQQGFGDQAECAGVLKDVLEGQAQTQVREWMTAKSQGGQPS